MHMREMQVMLPPLPKAVYDLSCWNPHLVNETFAVFWVDGNFRDWPDCERRGHDMSIGQYTTYRMWCVPTIYGETYVPHIRVPSIKRHIAHGAAELAQITKRRKERRWIGLVVNRRIGCLGFLIASYV